jgi:lipopolysaccharide export system permease protein
MTLLIFTFVMYIGAVIKAVDLMARGVPGAVVFKVFAYNIPYILSFSIPISTLTAVLLLFSRLSFDGEITAMRACGLGIWQVCAPILLLSVGLAAVCVYIHAEAAPNSHFARRNLLKEVGMRNPVELLEEGQHNDAFPGFSIYIGKKRGSRVENVWITELGDNGRTVRASSGTITVDEENEVFIVDLRGDVRIEEQDEYITAEHYVRPFPYADLIRQGDITKKERDFTMRELVEGIRDVRVLYPDVVSPDTLRERRMRLMIEASSRLAMSFCCVAFALLGVPLGMKSRRKESSVGIGISLFVVFVFYFFVILAQSLDGHPRLRPDLLPWVPVFAAQLVGILLLKRHD